MSSYITSELVTPTDKKRPAHYEDYSELLKAFDIQYQDGGSYLYSGMPHNSSGWIIHLSIIESEIPDTFRTILPFLKAQDLPFKIVATKDIAKTVLNGQWGYTQLGKIIAIYPPTEEVAASLTTNLVALTTRVKGPRILTDRHLGSAVYVRFGAHRPILRRNEAGIEENYYRDPDGQLIKDKYTIPFEPAGNRPWPFAHLAGPAASPEATTLQNRYKTVAVLKEDARGDVKKALRLARWWRLQWCILKEGRKHMFADDQDRDIGDRLRWQFEVQKDLAGTHLAPQVYELFQENHNTYLAMEFVNGQTLSHVTDQTFQNRHWSLLQAKEQKVLLSLAVKVVALVETLRAHGYVHRDLNPDNIMVRNNQLVALDFELVYSVATQFPSPPFKFGTFWFMSPEQRAMLTPTYAEDLYALGVMLVTILTGQPANKFAAGYPALLQQQLHQFMPDVHLTKLLTDCLAFQPECRPTLQTIKAGLCKATSTLHQALPDNHLPGYIEEKLSLTIQEAVNGLSLPPLLENSDLWLSPLVESEELAYYQTATADVIPTFYTGLSGICYVLARAHDSGFSIRVCIDSFHSALSFIDQYITDNATMSGGLYSGAAGLMTAYAATLKAGLAKDPNRTLEQITRCLVKAQADSPGVAKGIAGIGIALLHATPYIASETLRPLLQQIVQQLLHTQENDGSWLITTDDGKDRLKLTDFHHGASGIVCFLTAYAQTYHHSDSTAAVARAIYYLQKKISPKEKDFSLHPGFGGIILALIKGFELLGEPAIKATVINSLLRLPVRLTGHDMTLGTGLTGLGEIYLSAYRAFAAEEWKARATWITQMLLHQHQKSAPDALYWIPDKKPFSSADLFFGNTGILHFLLRSRSPETLSHPLLPFETSRPLKPIL